MCLLRLDVDSTIPIYFIKPTIKAASHFNSSSVWRNIEPLLICKCSKKKKKVQYLLQRKKCQLDMATWTNFVSLGIFYKMPFLDCFHLTSALVGLFSVLLSLPFLLLLLTSFQLSSLAFFSAFLLKNFVFVIIWIDK